MQKLDVSQNRHISGGMHSKVFTVVYLTDQGPKAWDEEYEWNIPSQNWCYYSGYVYRLREGLPLMPYVGTEYCYTH